MPAFLEDDVYIDIGESGIEITMQEQHWHNSDHIRQWCSNGITVGKSCILGKNSLLWYMKDYRYCSY